MSDTWTTRHHPSEQERREWAEEAAAITELQGWIGFVVPSLDDDAPVTIRLSRSQMAALLRAAKKGLGS